MKHNSKINPGECVATRIKMCALHVQKEVWVVARVVTRQVHPQVSMIFWSLNMIRVNLWDFFFSLLLFARQKSSVLLLRKVPTHFSSIKCMI